MLKYGKLISVNLEETMIKDFKFELEYKTNEGVKRVAGAENDLYAIKTEIGDDCFKLKLVTKSKIELKNAFITFGFKYEDEDKVYVNGYQSWTTSREFGKCDVQKGLAKLSDSVKLIRNFCDLFGDYNFQTYSGIAGEFHSYSYTYIKRGGLIKVLGTATERNGYTVIHHNMNANKITVQKDVEGVTVDGEYDLFDLVWTDGGYDEAFDAYFEKIGVKKPKYKRMAGYTSWYNYYGGITEKQLMRDLEGLATVGDKADIFQIDDGYQTKVGDWKTIKTDLYPHGMRYLTDNIHAKGYKAGLWMAPFNAAKDSKVVAEHPEWLIKDNRGKFELGSIAWGGAYTLDFYIPEAAAYIRSCFDTVFNDWNFDMVKLDFLYSICRTPRYNKSRGQIMTEAMEFLRDCLGDKIFLGCGVPLFPSFGVVDFCRISCDMGKSFKDPFYNAWTNQEIVSTRCAMNNTIFRRHLDGRAFGNDPDVFYLRDNNLRGKDEFTCGKSKLKFTDGQKELLAFVNSLCGNVLFVSDNVGGYSEKQREKLIETFAPTEKKVLDAEYLDEDTVSVTYVENGEAYVLTYDVQTGANRIERVE